MSTDKFRLLFFGSDQFSIRVLDHLLNKRLCPIQVVTNTHTDLFKFSSRHRLHCYPWRNGLTNVDAKTFNIGLVASFGNLIDEMAVNRFEYGLFNVHPSLLPQYRGSTPVQAAIFDQLKETGCTIMRIPPVARFDVGEIVLQEKLPIQDHEYAVDLRDRLADLGARMSEQFLLNYERCLQKSTPQGEQNKSLAKKLKPEQGHLKFKTETQNLLDRKVRAYTGFLELYITCLDGLVVHLEGMIAPREVDTYDLDCLVSRLAMLQVDSESVGVIGNYVESSNKIPVGTMYFHKPRRLLCTRAADGKWLAFKWATPRGKPMMSAADFYNGYLSKLSPRYRMTDA